MKFLRFRDLKLAKGMPFSRMHLDRLEKVGKFPKRVRLAPMTVAWLEDEIDQHIAAKLAERDAA